MSGARQQQQSRPAQQSADDTIVFSGFVGGLNSQSSRPGVTENQLAICDGWCPVGDDNLRTIWDIGPSIFTASSAGTFTVWFDFGNIGSTPYCIVVTGDGSVWAVNVSTGAINLIAVPGTITAGGSLAMTQWGSQYIIIVCQQANGYFVWDGTTFYRSGDTVPGDAGGVMPTGIAGSGVEIYAGHVWVIFGPFIAFSAPGSIVDFATADGGGNVQSNDSFLRVGYTNLKQSNGYLYLFGDSSISYIAGVNTSGSPATTTFTQQSVDPEVGTPWPGTVDILGSNIAFANPWGAHVSYGGRAAKISGMLDGIYNTAPNFGGVTPTACKHIMFGKRVWALLLPVIDQVTGQQVNKLFLWDEKKWFSTQQSVALIFVQHQEINSVLSAYGTDGNQIFPLFTTPSTAVTKTAQSRFWGNGAGLAFLKSVGRMWAAFQYFSTDGLTVDISIDSEATSATYTVQLPVGSMTWTNNLGNPINWTNNTGHTIVWGVGNTSIVVIPPQAVAQNGVFIGLTVSTNAADLALWSVAAAPVITQYRG